MVETTNLETANLETTDDGGVVTNYNDAGTTIMEMIYGHHYLSPGGADVSARLAGLARIGPGDTVLDMGCGLGGAARFLAETTGCTVRGVDLMAANVIEAQRRTSARPPSSDISFQCADALAVPFGAASFDVVWGQDAWCHIEDKAALIGEIKRVLCVGGRLVFRDWLLADPRGPNHEAIREVTASPGMGDSELYRRLLTEHGFEILHCSDPSEEVIAEYRGAVSRLRSMADDIGARFSDRVYRIVLEKQSFVLSAFESGQLKVGSFLAKKR